MLRKSKRDTHTAGSHKKWSNCNSTNHPSFYEGSNDQWVKKLHLVHGHDFRKWSGPNGQRCESVFTSEHRKDAQAVILARGPRICRRLAATLQHSWVREPSGLLMDPVTRRRTRINFVSQGSKLFAQHCANENLLLVSIVPHFGYFLPEDLHNASFKKIVAGVKRRLISAGLGDLVIVGCTDVTYNVHSANLWREHIQIHIHAVMAGRNKAELKEALEGLFHRTDTIRKPLDVRPVTDLMGGLGYCQKPYASRRVSYVNEEGAPRTRKLPLTDKQFWDLSLFFATQAVHSQFLFQGVRRRGGSLEVLS